ncbi:hypothetical protein JCM10908_004215 [Rhodotorula pacifica]|uniref:uncharacterized protein n=1 Tax=Rhodotorula pacifica TaxID=1495444 RepID=UPI00317E645D
MGRHRSHSHGRRGHGQRRHDDPLADELLNSLSYSTQDPYGSLRGQTGDGGFPDAQVFAAGQTVQASLSITEACQVQVLPVRPRLAWRRRLNRSATSSLLVPSGRPTPKRSQTRLVPLSAEQEDGANPLEDPRFLQGLRSAGYLEPLDVSRKATKSRFMHGLKKEEFQANLDTFLEDQQLKARGEYMIRFRGTATETHSPFVHIFTTALPTSGESCKVFPETTTSSNVTTWTALAPANGAGSAEWACKARKFWPVRVCLEAPEASAVVPAGGGGFAAFDGRAARRKRRDTFQREVDLDDEIREREKQEALELLKNTDANSVSLGGSSSLKIRTTKLETNSSSGQAVPNGDEPQSPSTPTILESVKQLGQSVAASVGPAVQQLPGAVNKSIGELREWFAQRQLPSPFEEEVEAEEERRHREKRRRRKERRRREEEAAAAAAAANLSVRSLGSRESLRGSGEHRRQHEHDSDREERRRRRKEERRLERAELAEAERQL